MDVRSFVDQWKAIGGDLTGAIAAFEAEWADEDPPWTMLLSQLGRDLAVAWSKSSRRTLLMELAERGLADGDDRLSNGVATGVLEALVTAVDQGVIDSRDLDAALGDESRAYIKAWRDFSSPQ